MAASARRCVRCRQELPEGSGYCVACGCANEEALLERRVKATNAADDRIGFARIIGGILGAIGRIFRGR